MNWRNVDVRLAITDAPVGNQPEKICCPFHNDPTASFSVYPDGGYCHGCHKRLPRMETLALLLFGSSEGGAVDRAFQVAHKYTVAELDAYRARVDENVKTDPLPWGLAHAYQSLLWGARQDRKQWLKDRGLSADTIGIYNLGHNGTQFTIPIPDRNNNLLTIRFRRDDQYGTEYFDPKRGTEVAIPKYCGLPGRNGLFLYPLHVLSSADWCVVVEGELDALRLIQEGIPAISATNGAGNVAKIPALLLRDAPRIKRLFIATDQDERGDEARIQTNSTALDHGLWTTRIEWPLEWGKDITEMMANGHSLEEAQFYGDDTRLPQA